MLSHFIGEETEVQNFQVTCSVLQDQQVNQERYEFMPARKENQSNSMANIIEFSDRQLATKKKTVVLF